VQNATTQAGERIPYFCSGCPHNTSTRVPEGSRAVAGIGCHYMAVWMDRSTVTFSQMGGEGVSWVGQAPFTTDNHIFANLGDGTYYHSGLLAVRQSIASGVNVTYKILFNDAVAMTGGQPIDGTLKVPEMTRELDAEGAKKIVVVTDEPEKYDEGEIIARLADGVTVRHRDDLDAVQRELREIPAARSSSTTRPARPRSAGAGSAARWSSRPSASSSTSWSAKAAATARCRATACRSSRSRPSSAASAASTRTPATRTIRA
jgi:TPP-dependent indolepyruvate ferredoxin oxidoreductase alpha subunit